VFDVRVGADGDECLSGERGEVVTDGILAFGGWIVRVGVWG